MAFFGKEIRKPNIRKFEYTVLNKKYIVEVETRFEDVINGEMYEFFLYRDGCGMKTHIIGFPADQTSAKLDPKYYTLEEALEMIEDDLMNDIENYEKEVDYLEEMYE